jgi:hypothetical protein
LVFIASEGGSHVKGFVAVLLADALLLIGLYYVIVDLQWRVAFATAPHAHTSSGYAASFSYSFLTQVFTMSGNGASLPNLTSPPTLDWVQVLGLALLAVNGWYLYSILAKRKKASPTPATASP